ncbi:hypothetical protein [Lysinibacter sp. HNR]|uniref:hypothetical protein n=1 Tax=Lysinibacter sp. HNR TaxID=3031408 RepID=UPI002435981D|nr:hypothetical protein [Lysinibacter sp. HNR]WGD38434.1 hypothetical protein FrondiHNR_05865 [Lysinibacter sp. HNR]
MRYFFAITTLVLAAVFIVLGIGQRTFLAGPASVSLSVEASESVRFGLIPQNVLSKYEGEPVVTIETTQGESWLGYGRSADVEAWLTALPHDVLVSPEGEKKLSAQLTKADVAAYDELIVSTAVITEPQTPAAPQEGPGSPATTSLVGGVNPKTVSPVGSDLWLQEFSAPEKLTQTLEKAEGTSVIVAAPEEGSSLSSISLTWDLDRSTPLAGPFLVGGILLGVIGAILYLLAIDHDRRKTRPRRGNNKTLAGLRRQSALVGVSPKGIEKDRRRSIGRGRLKMVMVPGFLVPALLLTGCSPDYWPSWDESAPELTSPTETAQPTAEAQIVPPAVTRPQLAEIMGRIGAVAEEADTVMSAELAATRFAGPALVEREANYKIRAALQTAAPPSSLTGTLEDYELPQSTTTWPRAIFSVVKDAAQSQKRTHGVVLIQQTPHENYHVNYVVDIIGGTEFPKAAPANIGTTRLAPDFKALVLQPGQVAAAYGDVLNQGEASPSYPLFSLESDELVEKQGVQWRQAQIAEVSQDSRLGSATFETVPGSGEVVAFSMAEQGALVAVPLDDKETISPTDARAEITLAGAPSPASVLAGTDKSNTGFVLTRGIQLLFYVPSGDSGQKIKLLGFTHSLIQAGVK